MQSKFPTDQREKFCQLVQLFVNLVQKHLEDLSKEYQ